MNIKTLSNHFSRLPLQVQLSSKKCINDLELSHNLNGYFRWLQDNINLIESVNEIEEVTNSVENSGDVYFVPAFSGLYAPYWHQDARG